MDKVDIDLKEYFVGQGGGYGGQPGGSIAATGWAGTYSSPQTSNRLNLHPDTGVTSYMQGNTIVRNALPDTILPQDLEGTPYDPDEIRLGLRSEMKKQEFPDKTKAKDTVLQNLAKNPKFYSDLLQYMNSDKGNIMETDIKQTDEAKSKDGFSSYKKKIAQQFAKGMDHEKEHTKDPKLAAKIAVDHIRGDQTYYDKLEAAGLEECGCDDMAPEANVAVIKIDPATQTGTVGGMVSGNQQKPLASSGLGVSGQPKPLTSTNIEAPDSKKVGPNTVATSKTPPVVSGSDPLDYFASKIQSALE